MIDDHFEEEPLTLPEGELVMELRRDTYRRLYFQQGEIYVLNEGWDGFHWTEKSFPGIEEIIKELDNWSMAMIDENFENVGNYLGDWMWLDVVYVGKKILLYFKEIINDNCNLKHYESKNLQGWVKAN